MRPLYTEMRKPQVDLTLLEAQKDEALQTFGSVCMVSNHAQFV